MTEDALLAADGDRNFFKNIKNYRSNECPKPFDVKSLFPGKSSKEVAEELAAHFNEISSEFDPLETHQIPVTRPRRLPILLPYEVAGRIRAFYGERGHLSGTRFKIR